MNKDAPFMKRKERIFAPREAIATGMRQQGSRSCPSISEGRLGRGAQGISTFSGKGWEHIEGGTRKQIQEDGERGTSLPERRLCESELKRGVTRWLLEKEK